MKKWQGIKIAAVVHTLLWVVVLAICVIGRLTFRGDPGMEPLELMMSKGIYNVFIIIAVAGIVNSALLSFSLRTVLAPVITKRKVLEKTALAFAMIANILFYLFAILLFLINSDALIVIPIIWLICVFCSCVMLLFGGGIIWCDER